MRIALVASVVLVCGIALPAFAQPAPPSAPPVAATGAKVDAVQARSKPPEDQEATAAALAMAIRQHDIEEQRIARIACAAGDTAKCQLVKADTTSKTPSP